MNESIHLSDLQRKTWFFSLESVGQIRLCHIEQVRRGASSSGWELGLGSERPRCVTLGMLPGRWNFPFGHFPCSWYPLLGIFWIGGQGWCVSVPQCHVLAVIGSWIGGQGWCVSVPRCHVLAVTGRAGRGQGLAS